MFSRIQNPETGKWVNVNGSAGQKILKNYLKQSGGSRSGSGSGSGSGDGTSTDISPLDPAPPGVDLTGVRARTEIRTAIPKLMKKFDDLKKALKLEVIKKEGGEPQSIVKDIDKLAESDDPLIQDIGKAAINLFTADEAPLKLSNLQQKLDPLRQAFAKYNEGLEQL